MSQSPISRMRGAYCGRYVLRGTHPPVYVADVMWHVRSRWSKREIMREFGISRAQLAFIDLWWCSAYGWRRPRD